MKPPNNPTIIGFVYAAASSYVYEALVSSHSKSEPNGATAVVYIHGEKSVTKPSPLSSAIPKVVVEPVIKEEEETTFISNGNFGKSIQRKRNAYGPVPHYRNRPECVNSDESMLKSQFEFFKTDSKAPFDKMERGLSDKIISLIGDMFPGKLNQFVANIGANDGVSHDPCLYLFKELGWSGIAVDPIPFLLGLLNLMRIMRNMGLILRKLRLLINRLLLVISTTC